MTSTTIARRAPRVRLPHIHLHHSPARRARRFEDALAELEAIDHRAARDLVAIHRHQAA